MTLTLTETQPRSPFLEWCARNGDDIDAQARLERVRDLAALVPVPPAPRLRRSVVVARPVPAPAPAPAKRKRRLAAILAGTALTVTAAALTARLIRRR